MSNNGGWGAGTAAGIVMGRMRFQLGATDRSTLVLMAIDANAPIFLLTGFGLVREGNPIAVLLEHPSLLLLAVAFPFAFVLARLYSLRQSWSSPLVLLRVLAATFGVVLAFCGGLAIAGSGPPREHLELLGVVGFGMALQLVATRGVLSARARRRRLVRPALVIGAGWAGRTVIDTTLREPRLRIKVCGVVDDDPLKRNFQYKGIPVVGTGRTLTEEVERSGASLVIMAISYAQNAELIKSLLELKMRGVEVTDMPGFCERATGQIPIKHVEDSWFLYSGGFELLHRPLLQKAKRVFDVAASLVGLVLSLPMMAVVAVAVKLDSKGPVFFRQERTGQGEKPFRLIKFRTMREDAESATGPVWASVRDYRVTRVGRWLRLTRLDEIPQFLNVLAGDMSFVGPRPERPFFVEKLKREIPYYGLRFAVKPGLTGWAQVQYHYGASVEDAIEKLKYDIYYVKNMSARLDLLIALKTVKVVLFARGT
jgi:sugar transferase (PEP-CTERM system associated)